MSNESGESLDVNLEDILRVAHRCANRGRQILLHYFKNLTQISSKDQAGLVSEADLESERVICEEILKHFPNHQILAEEESFKKEKESFKKISQERKNPLSPRWIIDPLDGTTNYIYNFPLFCISIGFETQGVIQLAMVDVPILKKRYIAVKGQGAFCNEEVLKVSQRNQMEEALLATGFFSENKPALEGQLRIFNAMVKKCRGVRRTGSAAYDLCLVAEGVFDVFWEANLKPWDTAAGSLLVSEAGGHVTNYEGLPFHPQMKSILATNRRVHSLCQNKILKHRKLSNDSPPR